MSFELSLEERIRFQNLKLMEGRVFSEKDFLLKQGSRIRIVNSDGIC